jgi:ubiquinone/menaquinone biosynthesis C-methylase UbiE
VTSPTLGNFSAVDDSDDTATLIAALDEQAAMPAIQRLRAAAISLLTPRFGDRIIDVGCGTGDTSRTLAHLVGPAGVVVGIEPSDTMLREARRRTINPALPVDFRPGDITALAIGDSTFDGVYCERVLQHVDAPHVAVSELVRVTRSGGRIVVVDTDWGMHAIHGADPRLTARIVDAWANNAANAWSGRRLPALFAAAGMPNPTVVAETVTSTDPHHPRRAPFTTIAAASHAAGITPADAARWLAQLADAGERGQFFWSLTLFAVAATRP